MAVSLYYKWNVDVVLLGLLQQLRLPTAHVAMIFNGVRPHFDEVIAACERPDGSWPFHLADRRYAWWPGCDGVLDLTTGAFLDRQPNIAAESVAYNLPEIARRKGGKDAAGDEGGGEEGGVREGVG